MVKAVHRRQIAKRSPAKVDKLAAKLPYFPKGRAEKGKVEMLPKA